MADLNPIVLALDIGVLILSITSLLLAFRKYKDKQNNLLLYLSYLFLFYTLYLIFNIAQRSISTLYFDSSFPTDDDSSNPMFLIFKLLYCLDLSFCAISSIFAYKFKNKTFSIEKTTLYSKSVFIVGIIALILSLMIAIPQISLIIALFAGITVTSHLFSIYIPFSFEAIKTYRRMKETDVDKKYTNAFLYIGIMALSMVLRNISFYMDAIPAIIQPSEWFVQTNVSPFYLMGWMFLIIAYIAAYFGYIKPGRTKENIE